MGRAHAGNFVGTFGIQNSGVGVFTALIENLRRDHRRGTFEDIQRGPPYKTSTFMVSGHEGARREPQSQYPSGSRQRLPQEGPTQKRAETSNCAPRPETGLTPTSTWRVSLALHRSGPIRRPIRAPIAAALPAPIAM